MNQAQYLIFINEKDRTDSVADYRFCGDKCEVVFNNSPKVYSYNSNKVRVLKSLKQIKPNDVIVYINGDIVRPVRAISDFGSFYRIIYTDMRSSLYPKSQVELHRNCLANDLSRDVFEYFKKTAASISLRSDDGYNILWEQYNRIQYISESTALACYLDANKKPIKRSLTQTILYPFGLNQSQKTAVENALSSQISIIQGPPGTGETQTILNIVANVVFNGQTVAVVSNNNSATLNVAEKLKKNGFSFLTAFLGSRENKNRFLETQTGLYPDMSEWMMEREERGKLERAVTELSKELDVMFEKKNRIAAIEQELLQLVPEEHYFSEYYNTYAQVLEWKIKELPSQKLMNLWLEYENQMVSGKRIGIFQKIIFMLQFGRRSLKMFRQPPEAVIPYIQREFYRVHAQELRSEKLKLERELEQYSFEEKVDELGDLSQRLFRAKLSIRFRPGTKRPLFQKSDLQRQAREFNQEYPVILSTTYSLKNTLSPDHIYDYVIVDEASQVDLTTGVLALACARNIVIVGDLQQLPNVLDSKQFQKCEDIWSQYSLPDIYRASKQSLLSSAVAAWPHAPSVLLREHYRCHPKIISFCNQKYYGGQLIIMTKDNGEPNVLTMYRTAPGNHARAHYNQRQIDVISQEVLPSLKKQGYKNIGIIAPYRDQVTALHDQLGNELEIDTVHKFQGREKEAIVLSSVDNVITKFVDDPHMLNVAVSRAVKSLTVVTSQDARNDHSNYGDLARYISYNNCAVIESTVYSVFDLLYRNYAWEREEFLQKHGRVSEYDSENLLYAVIRRILEKEEYSFVDCAVHVSLVNILKDYSLLDTEEAVYAKNPLTHVDFLLFRRVDKSPLFAIEVDGTAFHAPDSVQAVRDKKKDRIFEKYNIPLLRFRTDGSGEREKIEAEIKPFTTTAAFEN